MARRKKRGIAARSPEAEAAALFRRGEALMARGLKAEVPSRKGVYARHTQDVARMFRVSGSVSQLQTG